MSRLRETPFTLVSVKTIDDSRSNAEVVEIACARIRNLAVTEAALWQVNPQVSLPEELTRQTGFYGDVLRDKPLLETVLPEVAAFIGRDVILWTVHPRRLNAVHKALRLTQPRDKEIFLLTLAQALLPDLSRHSLMALSSHFQLPSDLLFRAEPAARTGAAVFAELAVLLESEHQVETMPALLSFCPRPGAMRRKRNELPFDSDRLRQYPTTPGVYFMKNRLGEILYIGKAKNLRNRLRSYFQDQRRLPAKVAALMKQVYIIDVTQVGSELEALLLEARLIKQHQPFFNKKIKNYQGMVFMGVSLGDDFPRVSAAEEPDEPESAYFGPFARRAGLEARMEILNRVFQLRSCSDHQFAEHSENPCMQYHLGLCSGPCAGLIAMAEYRERVTDFLEYLQYQRSNTVDYWVAKRDAYTEELMFEKAAAVQYRLEALESLQWRSYSFIKAIEAHHCVIVLPDLESGAFRLLGVLAGQPVLWKTFHPQRDAQAELYGFIDALLEAQEQLEHPGMRTTVPKAMFEETRLLSSWLQSRTDEEGAVIALGFRTADELASRLLLAMSATSAMPEEELLEPEWEYEEINLP